MTATFFILLTFSAAMEKTALPECVDVRGKMTEEQQQTLASFSFPRNFFANNIYSHDVANSPLMEQAPFLWSSAIRYAFADPSAPISFDFHRQLLRTVPYSIFPLTSLQCFITETSKYIMFNKSSKLKAIFPDLFGTFKETKQRLLSILEILRGFENSEAFVHQVFIAFLLGSDEMVTLRPVDIRFFCKRNSADCVVEEDFKELANGLQNHLITLKINRLIILSALKHNIILRMRELLLLESRRDYIPLMESLKAFEASMSRPDAPVATFRELSELIRNAKSKSELTEAATKIKVKA